MEIALPHERLDVYRISLDYVTLARRIIDGLPKGRAILADQLASAAFSITLNIAEGSGEFSPKEKARFYRMALRSATECAAVMDILRREGSLQESDHQEGRILLDRIVGMLTRLVHVHRA